MNVFVSEPVNLDATETTRNVSAYNGIHNNTSGSAVKTASQVINTLLMITTLWLVTSFIAYGRHSGKWQRKKKNDYAGGVVLTLAVLSAVMVLPRLIFTQVIILVGNDITPGADLACEIALDFSIVLFFLALLPTYSYLWMRQRALYAQPSINKLYSKWIQILTWGSYTVLVTSGLGIIVLFVLPDAYRGSTEGCILRTEEEDNILPFYIMAITQVLGQCVLVALFLYPLKLHRKVQLSLVNMRKTPKSVVENEKGLEEGSYSIVCKSSLDLSQCDKMRGLKTAEEDNLSISRSNLSLYRSKSETCIDSTSRNIPIRQSMGAVSRKVSHGLQQKFKTNRKSSSNSSVKNCNRVLKVMRRSVICTTICILSDLAAMAAVAFLLPKQTPKSLTNSVYDISLLVNVFSVIMSFENYHKILFFFCSHPRSKTNVSIYVTGSQSPSLDGLSVN